MRCLASHLQNNPNPADFEPESDLPVIDAESALEQCCDWSFVVELLDDVLAERETMAQQLVDAAQANDHTAYHKAAHALKGAALNLHLPALIDVSRKAELLGKQLELTPSHQDLLDMRQLMVEHLQIEYGRLDESMPEMRQQAEQEAAGGGEGQPNGDEQSYQDESYNQHQEADQ